MKDKSPWNGAHVRLKKLYEERVPEGITQKQFGLEHGIGSQSMVAQYLNGTTPLNYESAAKFARALHCTIYDISPEMAESLQLEILPFLGKALRRAASLAAFAVLPALTPSPADAQAPTLARAATQLCIMLRSRISEIALILVMFLTTLRRNDRNISPLSS